MTGDAFLLYDILVFFLSMGLTVTRNEMSAIEGRLLADGALSIGATDHSWKAMGVAMGRGVSWAPVIGTCTTSQ
jgi:hypothetical protein